MNKDYLSIGAVERDSGIARDTLRIWERRYGFPEPVRNDKGERMYPAQQLRRLQRIRRLLDQGLRPGKVVALTDAMLDILEADLHPVKPVNDKIEGILNILHSGDTAKLETALSDIYQQQAMYIFITETVAPLLQCIGERWASGRLQVFEEHLISQVLTRFLNTQISAFGQSVEKTKVLLATLPGEEHTLGLLMVAALLSSRGVSVINLGGEVPLDQLVSAIQRFDATAVGITFSASYQYENIRINLSELRDSIADDVEIWAGGEGVRRLRKLPPGVIKFKSLH